MCTIYVYHIVGFFKWKIFHELTYSNLSRGNFHELSRALNDKCFWQQFQGKKVEKKNEFIEFHEFIAIFDNFEKKFFSKLSKMAINS